MNELIQALGGPEIFPFYVGALALIIVLIAVFWLIGRSSTEAPGPEPRNTQPPAVDVDSQGEQTPALSRDAETEGLSAVPVAEPPQPTAVSAPKAEDAPAAAAVAKAAPVAEKVAAEVAEQPKEPLKELLREQSAEPVVEAETWVDEAPEARKARLFGRIKQGLGRTKANLTQGLSSLFLGAREIDEDLLEEIETQLLMADIGVDAASEIINKLTAKVERKQLGDADALYGALKQELAALLVDSSEPWVPETDGKPYVILMVGVNGVGKTTTIGKLAKRFQSEGRSVMLAAGDTFRAAAVEQLQVWGERNQVPVVAQHSGADSASVIFDAVQSAKARNIDVVIADTAGRLQNKAHLMAELEKVVRVMKKLDDTAPHEVMLVLDAGTGQNALSQARQFGDSVGVSGITLTKLDGTAKGGIIFAIAKQMQLPIRFIGVGEQIDDLRPFDAEEFVAALFSSDD